MSEKEYNFDDAEQGPVVPSLPNTTQITIRIDSDILDWFRRQVHETGGGNYQALINDVLRTYVQSKTDTFESTMRRAPQKKLQSVIG